VVVVVRRRSCFLEFRLSTTNCFSISTVSVVPAVSASLFYVSGRFTFSDCFRGCLPFRFYVLFSVTVFFYCCSVLFSLSVVFPVPVVDLEFWFGFQSSDDVIRCLVHWFIFDLGVLDCFRASVVIWCRTTYCSGEV
jgi:hypothetical protein